MDRLFCCNTILQCGWTWEIREAKIETWLTLHHRTIINLSISNLKYIFFCLHIRFTASGVLNSLVEFYITCEYIYKYI